MALKVGELYASMRLDNSAFDKGLDESGRRFGKLQSVIASGVKTGAKVFAGLVTGASALGIAATKAGIEYNGLRQLAQAALTTVTGSAEEAAAQMERLDSFGATSWVMRDKLLEAQKLMTGFGIETSKVIPYLDGLQKGIAAAGQGNEEFSRAAEIMAEIQSNTKITGDHVRRLGILGIDAADAIGKTLGKSGEQVRKSITEGSLDAETALDALAEGLATKFPDAVENVRNTWQGAVDNMSAAWRDFGAELARPLVDPQGGGLLVGWVNELADTFWLAAEKARPLVDLLVQRFAPGIASVSPAIERVQGAINAWDISKVNSQLDSLTKYTPLIAGTSAALFALGTTNLPILSSLGFTGINPVVAGLAALVATSPAARDALSGVFSAASPLAETAKELGITLSDTLMYAINELVPAAGALAVAFVEAGVPLVQSLTPALVSLMTAALPVVDVVASLAQWVADLPTPVLAAGLAFAALMGPLKPVTDGLANVAQGFVRIIQQAQVQAVLGNTNIAMGGLARASAVAGPAISGVGTALKAAFVSSGIGIAIAGITAAIGYFVSSQAEAKRYVDDLAASLDEQTGAWTANTHEIIVNRLEANGTAEAYQRLGGDVSDLIPYLQGSAEAQARVNSVLSDANRAAHESVDAWGVATDAQTGYDESGAGLLRTIGKVTDGLGASGDALDESTEKAARKRDMVDSLADSEDAATDSVQRHIDALREQTDALLEGADASIGQSKALRRQEEAQDRTREALKKLKKTTDDSEASERDLEKARRDVEAALDDEAASNIDLIGAMQRNNASTDDLRAATQKARDEFIKHAQQLGLTKDEARALADQYGLIPSKVHTTITAETKVAQQRIKAVQDALARVNSKTVTLRVQTLGSAGSIGDVPGLGHVNKGMFADGGFLPKSATIQGPRPELVQWAEPETHGEAFIPFAPSKRARSLQIWEETGRRLGAFAARSFADGGLRGARAAAPAVNVSASFPSHVTLVDSSGALLGRMQVVARGEVDAFERDLVRGRR